MIYTLHFFLFKMQVCFIIINCLVPVIFKFYIQGVLKLKKNNSGTERLMTMYFSRMLIDIYNETCNFWITNTYMLDWFLKVLNLRTQRYVSYQVSSIKIDWIYACNLANKRKMLKRIHNIFGSLSWTLSGRVRFGHEVSQNMRVVWPCIFLMKWCEMSTWCN